MTGQYHGFSNLQVLGDQPGDYIEYTVELAPVVAHILVEIKNRITSSTVTKDVHGSNFHVTYSLKKGLQKFQENGEIATTKELKQMHDRVLWAPTHKATITPTENKKAMRSLLFLTEKESVDINK